MAAAPPPRPSPVLWPWALVVALVFVAAYLRSRPAARPPAPPPLPSAAAIQLAAAPAEAPAAVSAELRHITNWGPRSARVKTAFNVQPTGDSAFWIVGRGSRKVRLELAGTPLRTVVREDGITASLAPEVVQAITARPGNLPLYLVDQNSKRRQLVGFFEVRD